MIALDLAGALFCGVMSICLFGMHVVTHPKRFHWMTLPEYVRRGIVAAGVLFLLRSVELTNVSNQASVTTGHINPMGLLALLTLTYLTLALTYWMVTKVLPKNAWQRVYHVAKEEQRTQGELVPMMVTKSEVTDISRAVGMKVIPPGGGPEELIGPNRSFRA